MGRWTGMNPSGQAENFLLRFGPHVAEAPHRIRTLLAGPDGDPMVWDAQPRRRVDITANPTGWGIAHETAVCHDGLRRRPGRPDRPGARARPFAEQGGPRSAAGWKHPAAESDGPGPGTEPGQSTVEARPDERRPVREAGVG